MLLVEPFFLNYKGLHCTLGDILRGHEAGHVVLFCVKCKVNFCCRFIMKHKQKNKVNKLSVNPSVKKHMLKVEM